MKNPQCGDWKRTCCCKASNGHRINLKDLSEITYFLGMWIVQWRIARSGLLDSYTFGIFLNNSECHIQNFCPSQQEAGLSKRRTSISNLSTQSASDKWMVRCHMPDLVHLSTLHLLFNGRPRSPPNQSPSSKVSIVTNRVAQSTWCRSGLIWTIFCYDRYQWITATPLHTKVIGGMNRRNASRKHWWRGLADLYIHASETCVTFLTTWSLDDLSHIAARTTSLAISPICLAGLQHTAVTMKYFNRQWETEKPEIPQQIW